ncbi:hypothetical protein JCM14713_32530 [Desulfomicrobium salsuginis]
MSFLNERAHCFLASSKGPATSVADSLYDCTTVSMTEAQAIVPTPKAILQSNATDIWDGLLRNGRLGVFAGPRRTNSLTDAKAGA